MLNPPTDDVQFDAWVRDSFGARPNPGPDFTRESIERAARLRMRLIRARVGWFAGYSAVSMTVSAVLMLQMGLGGWETVGWIAAALLLGAAVVAVGKPWLALRRKGRPGRLM